MVDFYTKTILMVIATALVAIVVQQATSTATAQTNRNCGTTVNTPCTVVLVTTRGTEPNLVPCYRMMQHGEPCINVAVKP